jgi:hypothetical protein
MTRAALRLVARRAPRRPSCIVDVSTVAEPRIDSPWSVASLEAMQADAIPMPVTVAMYVAAWARAEHCGLTIVDRRLEPWCRYRPTAALEHAIASSATELVGIVGFAVPLLFNERRVAFAASWPLTWVRS